MARPLVGAHDGCALHGALATVAAIDGATPLVHSTPGCALRGAFSTLGASDVRGAPIHLSPISSTNLAEKHIVFGGASRLREQIKNTLSVLPRGLLVVLTGCPTEMIGDDVPAMVREAVAQGEAVLDVGAAGFLGSAHRGYERVLAALAARGGELPLPSAPLAPGLVNIFGVVPRYDETWASDLDEISRLLAQVGLTANTIFGPGGGLASLAALPSAAASLVLSPWGLPAADALRAKGVPVVVADGLPVGADAVETVLQDLAAATGAVEPTALARARAAERRYEDFVLDESLDALTRLGRRRAAIVGNSLHAGSLARFLVVTLGWEASVVVLTDEPDAHETHAPEAGGRIVATADGVEAADAIRASGADVLIAAARYGALADELGIPFASIADQGGRAALAGGFVGARGAGRLLAALTGSLAAPRLYAPGPSIVAERDSRQTQRRRS